MNRQLYPEMFAMEERHWWFRGKHQVVDALLARYLRASQGRRRVADLGCGCGMMPFRLQSAGYDTVGVDSSDDAIAFAERRGVRVEKGGLPEPVPLPDASFDAVLLLDVLEHVEYDAASVRRAAHLLTPGGVMICTVPAYQWLYTRRDKDHEHFRRYGRRQFRALFEIPEVTIELLTHYNFWLFPIAAATRLMGKVMCASKGAVCGDLHVPPAPVNEALRVIFAGERHLLGRVVLPWGLSLISVTRRTG